MENIIIRQLSDLQAVRLEDYKNKFGHKTASKAVLSMIEHYQIKLDLIESQRIHILELEEECSLLKSSISDYLRSFNNLSGLIKKK